MGGEAVPQCVNTDTFSNAGTPRGQANDPVELARTRMPPAVAGEQPGLSGRHPSLFARSAPPVAQYLEKVGRENDIPILLALALFDPDDHPLTVDIGELERYDLRGSQAGGISQAQERLVLDVRRRGEQSADLFRAENNGEAARLTGRHDEIGKLFDVADVLVLSPGIEPPDRHVLDQPPAYGTDGLLGHWGLLSWVRF